MLDELNIKAVEVVDSVADLLKVRVAVNKKVAGPKFGKQLAEVTKSLESALGANITAAFARGESYHLAMNSGVAVLQPGDLEISFDSGEDWAAAVDGQTAVLVDKLVTTELRHEGLARDLVRNIQNLRKDADFNVEDRIRLSIQTSDAALRDAVRAFRHYICDETLAQELTDAPLSGANVQAADLKLDAADVHLEVARLG
jgi:isoleucyl-tRNA synthetase